MRFNQIAGLERIEECSFRGVKSLDQADRMYGGLLIGQALAACQRTVENDREVNSLHCYFLRPGNTAYRVDYRVGKTRDGRSYSHREVHALQGSKELFRMVCSFAVESPSPEFVGTNAPQVPSPSEVTYTYSDFCRDQMPDPDYIRHVSSRPFEIKYINPPTEFKPTAHVENQLMWMKLTCNMGTSSHDHHVGIAYLSDSTLIDHVTLPHGKRWQDSDFDGTSLDHAMWFHRFARADEWLLFDQAVEWTGDGRGLASGRIYDQEGRLVATCMQEGLMRFASFEGSSSKSN